jgi:DNA-binding beta-propeller fold protein YncE
VRKDIAAQIWEFAAAPVTEEVIADPYEGGEVSKPAQAAVGQQGSLPGQLNRPRDLAFAPDGSLYVADTDNHRIQHLSQSGQVLHVWGSFADILAGAAPGGSFNQPWGIAVGPDGSVYVADTWNHRIQKFTAGGEFVQMWGVFGQAEDPSAFWGPRDVMVDPAGRVFVTDTGNKRVVVFDSQGQYLAQFGSFGLDSGQFDEPVGLAMDAAGRVYVTDTWNQRVQVFAEGAAGDFSPVASWEIAGWYGQSLDNKPFIAVSGLGQVIISDPEGYRVIEFTTEGKFVRYWGAFSAGLDGFGLPAGLAFDSQDRLWVADAGNHRILTFDMP